MLGHDAMCYFDWVPMEAVRAVAPSWHFLHVSRDAIPALRSARVTGEQIGQMTVGNPRRCFEHGRTY